MGRFITVSVLVALVGCLALAGCTSSEEPAVEAEPEPLDEETAAVARTRGVATSAHAEDAEEASPQVVLSELTYEWRTHPDRGLQVILDFTNPVTTYERARGYVFLIATSTMSGREVTGVYPWNTDMEGALPEDYTDGAHLLYRDHQQVRGFIPYSPADGHYQMLRVYVFHEDGRLLTNRTYDLEITGAPGESRTINPGFDL